MGRESVRWPISVEEYSCEWAGSLYVVSVVEYSCEWAGSLYVVSVVEYVVSGLGVCTLAYICSRVQL